MRVYLMSGDIRKMNSHIVTFLYQRFKIKFPLLKRFNLLSLLSGSLFNGCLAQSAKNLHLMLSWFKGIFLLFLLPYQIFIILLLDTLGQFLGWTLLHSILTTVRFVDQLKEIDELGNI